MPLSELECRRSEWQAGAEVVLSDGQAWHFPRPRLTYRLHIDPETRAPIMRADATTQSPTYAELLDRLDSDSGEMFSLMCAMALELLRENYNIPDEAVPDLFTFDPSSEISRARWAAIGNAVRGIGSYPKL